MNYDSLLRSRNGVIVPPDLIPNASCKSPSTEFYCEYGHPIEFSENLASIVFENLLESWSLGFPYDYKVKNLDINVGSETYKLMLALKSYQESNNPLLPIGYLIQGILKGPSFIVFLKKLRSYHMVVSSGGFFLEDDPDIDEVKRYSKRLPPLDDVGQIFNYRYWFFWDQPDSHDELATEIPIHPISEQDLQKLEDVCYNLLPDDIDIIQPEEILLAVSGSSARTKEGKTSKVFVEKQKSNHFTSEPLEGWGSYIQKCPGDTRFSTTLSVPHSNTVKFLEKQIALIASECPWSCYTADEDEYFKRYNKFKDNCDTFLCRDLKKDGLTKPRACLRAIGRALIRKYPEMPALRYLGIYDGFTLHYNGEEHHPVRGVGLGMSSAITTILQSALMRISLDELYDDEDSGVGLIDALIYHDDIAIGSNDENTIDEYNSVEDRVLARYQCIKNARKSFRTNWFVLCENYSDTLMDEKDSYQRYLLETCHAAANVSHAKQLFGSIIRFVHTIDVKPYLLSLSEHFGFEYYYNEIQFPYQLGGWVPAYYMSVDIALYVTEEIGHLQQAAALSYTIEKPVFKQRVKKFSKELYKPPVTQLFGSDLNYGSASKSYLINMTERQVAASYNKFTSIGEKGGYWNHLLELRRKSFKLLMLQPELSTPDFFTKYHNLHKEVDIIPPPEILISEDVEKYPLVDRIYRPTNPYMQYLKFLNPEKIRSSVMPWPIPPGLTMNKKLALTSEERRQAQYNTTLLRKANYLGELNLWKPPTRNILSKSFFNPHQVRSCMIALTNSDCLPISPPRKTLEQIETISPYLHLYLCSDMGSKLINKLHSRLPWEKLRDIQYTDLADNLWDIIRDRKHAKETLANLIRVDFDIEKFRIGVKADDSTHSFGTTVSHITLEGYSDTPLNDNEYFIWKTSHKKYKDWRNEYFISILDKELDLIMENELDFGRDALDTHNRRLPEECILEDVEKFLWTSSGGQLIDDKWPLWKLSILDTIEPGEENEDIKQDSDPYGGSDSGSGFGLDW